jgi:hypothetical protein
VTRRTSIAAYHHLVEEGALSRRRSQVYAVVFRYGPMTAQECFKSLGLETNQSGRFTELRDMGLLYEQGTKTCNVTGREAISWDVTELADPIPLKKQKFDTAPLRILLNEYALTDSCKCTLFDQSCRYCRALDVLKEAV